ncbi:hypothetical protein AQUCO_02000563v1 [Aquilegia coerulea]|uniref:SHSP domain-containing protein n=1 Tax=Aquilegia coerulea TaxID=218851 RepID=A0A2G5DI62_AQUCA|nr:hypothetical protein AQUCO_02000563v1 [Aquilegia coerulea]
MAASSSHELTDCATSSPIVDELNLVGSIALAKEKSSIANEPFHLAYNRTGKKISSPPVNILETSKEYVLFCDVPGFTMADIQVKVEEAEKVKLVDTKSLLIESKGIGNGKRKREEEGSKYIRLEKEVSPIFSRKFLLPTNCNLSSAILPICKNGLLTVRVQKLRIATSNVKSRK